MAGKSNNPLQFIRNIPSLSIKTIVLLVLFASACVLVGGLAYRITRDVVSSWELTDLPGISIRTPTPIHSNSEATIDPNVPLQAPGGPPPPEWDGASRITILILGLDYRDWEAGNGPPRSDTMILFSIDPLTNSAVMLSIPRDLWVNIPGGFKYGKINTAYQLGEAYQLPGGGPGLAMDTTEELLGVPIDYYAQVDFSAFERFIDEIHGVKLNITEKITIVPIGEHKAVTLQPGIQTLPGYLALAYARARSTEGGDFDRAQRQQQVIMAIRARVLSFDLLPILIAKAGTLYTELSGGIHTNFKLDDAIRIAWLAQSIDDANIQRAVIDTRYVTFHKSPEGLDVLKPIPDEIRSLRDELFNNLQDVSVTSQMSLESLVKEEAASLSVYNGTYTPGLAAKTSQYMESLGFDVPVVDNSSRAVSYTEITMFSAKPYTLKYLLALMEINQYRISIMYNPDSEVDFEIILGDDWAGNNPMP